MCLGDACEKEKSIAQSSPWNRFRLWAKKMFWWFWNNSWTRSSILLFITEQMLLGDCLCYAGFGNILYMKKIFIALKFILSMIIGISVL
jgi:hypothetical protein